MRNKKIGFQEKKMAILCDLEKGSENEEERQEIGFRYKRN